LEQGKLISHRDLFFKLLGLDTLENFQFLNVELLVLVELIELLLDLFQL